MLKLILGPSGSGKTQSIVDSIRADILAKRRAYLLVPEQQAYISERDLPAALPENAGLYFEVVNFSRLAETVFREYGGVTTQSINPASKLLLMWDTLRRIAPHLSQYRGGSGSDATLPAMMLSAIEDFSANGISGEDLEQAAEGLPKDSPLQKKLSDLALIDATYRARCEEAFGSDPSDKLLRMTALLQQHPYFADCNLYVDSFTSFTYPEYMVLTEILRQAGSVTVALCADDFASRLPHFAGTVRTAHRLCRLASDIASPIERTILSADPAKKPRALSMLERDLWRFDLDERTQEKLSTSEKSVIQMLVAANLYEESEAAALHILSLVQSGMRYGDIAIVVRDAEVYRGVLDAAMERHGIPFFFSERTDLTVKPLARLILSALRCVSHYYRTQDVMTLLKTGLVGVSPEDAAMFEEYADTWHINGARFLDPVWSMNPDGLTTDRSPRADRILEAANRVRTTLIAPLERLSANLRGSGRLVDRCRALYDYLLQLNIAEQLSERAKGELACGARRQAGETVRLYQFTLDTISSLCRLMPDAEVSVDELILALTMLFSETDLGSVPSLHDCVMIGSASTLRVENVKASLLLGLCEGEFPAAVTDGGILSESEKVALEEFGIVMDTNAALRSAEELLYVYRAVTKPTQRLFLSTIAKQTDGSARTPSLAFSRIKFLLGEKKTPIFDAEAIRRALDLIPSLPKFDTVGVAPITEPITLRLSQSKIKTFALCPYQYYLVNRLKLREQKDSRPSYADDGTFLHYVLEHFLRRSLGTDHKLHVPPANEIPAIAHEIVEEYIERVCPIPPELMDKRLLHLFLRLERLSLSMLRDILEELHTSRFVPSKFEQIIGGYGENGLPPVTFSLSGGSRVTLSGAIDRVDLYDENGKCYVRVVDYKSSTHTFRTEDVRTGQDIQLILYLFAFCSSDPDHYAPGGAHFFYADRDKNGFSIKRSGFFADQEAVRLAADTSESPKKVDWKTVDEIRDLTEDMKAAVVSIAERILAGEAKKTPSEAACRFCPARTHCDRACRGKSF